MDSFLSFEFDKWGFSVDSAPVYLSLSWSSLIVLGIEFIGYKIYKRNKNVF